MKTIAVLCVLVAAVIAGPVKDFNRKAHIEGRITGGAVAAPHQFPYQVGLLLRKASITGDIEVFWCGGSLISNKVVLTAAHCVDGVFEADVSLGAQAMLKPNEGRVDQKVYSQHMIIHSKFDANLKINDIALIILPDEVVLNEYVQTVNLPHPDLLQTALEGQVAVISGWGIVGDRKDVSWNDLLYVNLRILPGAACEQTYPGHFHQTQICVSGDNHKSMCSGDSGGPLVISEPDGSKTVVGLASFQRAEGCEVGYPNVFTRVTSYLDWIAKNSGVVPKRY